MSAVTRHLTSHGILVLDADQPSALAIVRALGERGLPVTVASSSEKPLAGYSRHALDVLQYPDPLAEEHAFIAWLGDSLCARQFDLVMPVTERTLVPLLRHRERLDDRRIAMAPSDALEQVLDKERTNNLAESLGIPVPRSITAVAIEDIDQAEAELGYPLVVKPARSVGSDSNQRVQLSVSYAHSRTELELRLRHVLRFGPAILQELFQGDGVGIELLADHGVIRYAFQHRRLHEVPLTGGGSSLRISEKIIPELLEASTRLMRALDWHGVAMVEFKYNPQDKTYRLMEINGRFWGSLPLAIAAGANFPVMLHELLTTGKIGHYPPAREGIVCRQLGRDIDWLEHVLRGSSLPKWVSLPSRRDIFRDTLLVFSPRHHFDVQSFRDIRPGLIDLQRIATKQWHRISGNIKYRHQLTEQLKAAQPGGAARQKLANARSILFLCYGNINRSALAHAYALKRYPAMYRLASAGFHTESDRPADPRMVEAAHQCDVDLQDWRSRTVENTLINESDIIFAMETKQVDRLLSEFPEAKGKTFLLGASSALKRTDVEISDPYGKAPEIYVRVRDKVIASVDAWFTPSLPT